MPDISRRSLAAGVGLLAGAMAVPAAAQQQLAAADAPKFRVQPLTFNPDKIKWLSAQSIAEHHGSMPSSVNRLNAITEQLAQLDLAKAQPAEIGELKREQQGVYNSSLLHELYFECIGDAPTQPVRRVRAGDQPRFRQPRSLEGRVRRHGQGADRRHGPGDPGLHAARQAADQSPRRRSRDGARSAACR